MARAARSAAARGRRLNGRLGFERRLLWIFGSPRSGSTWLLQMLGEHPRVVAINEPLIGYYLGPFLSDLPGASAAKMDVETFTARRAQRDQTDQFFSEEFRDVWTPGLRKLMLERFWHQALRYPAEARVKDTVVAIKEPNGSQSADLIMSTLPRARLLFLVRDGRDVVDSELAANAGGAWLSEGFAGLGGIGEAERHDFVSQSALKWLWRTEVVESALAEHPGPKLVLRYEDLRRDPAMHLRTVLRWLELETDEAQLGSLIDRHSFEQLPPAARGPDRFFRAAQPGLWRENLSLPEQETVHELIGPKLRELGYDA
jgi:hypothetical protein